MTEKRNQDGLTDREKAETNEMESAGFVWDPTGDPRWTHPVLEVTVLRHRWMRDHDWDKHRAKKIAEARGLIPFRELAIGARFRFRKEVDPNRRVYVKLPGIPGMAEFQVIEWTGYAVQHVPQGLSNEDVRQIVERFEPFAELTPAEFERLPTFPQVWTALAEWHSSQSAEAESQDWVEPMRWHDEREAMCRTIAADIATAWING